MGEIQINRVALQRFVESERLVLAIGNGTYLHVRNPWGIHPLFKACKSGNQDAVKYIIESESSLNTYIPGHVPVNGRHASLVDVNMVDPDRDNFTPMHYLALYHGRVPNQCLSILKTLIHWGGDVYKASNHGYLPLHALIRGGHTATARYLLEHCGMMDRLEAPGGPDHWTPFHYATAYGRLKATRMLLRKGCDPRVPTGSTEQATALHLAARNGKEVIVEYLIDAIKFDVDTVDAFGSTAAHYACQDPHVKDTQIITVLCSLKKRGAKLDKKNKLGRSPLFDAVASRQNRVIRFLVEIAMLDINELDGQLHTPLYHAVLRSDTNPGVVVNLVSLGASVHLVDASTGDTMLHLLVRHTGKKEILRLLMDQGLDKDVNVSNRKGQTPFHLACMYGEPSTVHLLINAGADVSITDNDGNTGLHYACQREPTVRSTHRRLMLVKFLVQEAKMDASQVNKAGETALDVARATSQSGLLSQRDLPPQHPNRHRHSLKGSLGFVLPTDSKDDLTGARRGSDASTGSPTDRADLPSSVPGASDGKRSSKRFSSLFDKDALKAAFTGSRKGSMASRKDSRDGLGSDTFVVPTSGGLLRGRPTNEVKVWDAIIGFLEDPTAPITAIRDPGTGSLRLPSTLSSHGSTGKAGGHHINFGDETDMVAEAEARNAPPVRRKSSGARKGLFSVFRRSSNATAADKSDEDVPPADDVLPTEEDLPEPAEPEIFKRFRPNPNTKYPLPREASPPRPAAASKAEAEATAAAKAKAEAEAKAAQAAKAEAEAASAAKAKAEAEAKAKAEAEAKAKAEAEAKAKAEAAAAAAKAKADAEAKAAKAQAQAEAKAKAEAEARAAADAKIASTAAARTRPSHATDERRPSVPMPDPTLKGMPRTPSPGPARARTSSQPRPRSPAPAGYLGRPRSPGKGSTTRRIAALFGGQIGKAAEPSAPPAEPVRLGAGASSLTRARGRKMESAVRAPVPTPAVPASDAAGAAAPASSAPAAGSGGARRSSGAGSKGSRRSASRRSSSGKSGSRKSSPASERVVAALERTRTPPAAGVGFVAGGVALQPVLASGRRSSPSSRSGGGKSNGSAGSASGLKVPDTAERSRSSVEYRAVKQSGDQPDPSMDHLFASGDRSTSAASPGAVVATGPSSDSVEDPAKRSSGGYEKEKEALWDAMTFKRK